MIKFQTVVSPVPLRPGIAYSDPVMLVGSCFSDVLGPQFQQAKFSVVHNPLGTVYHPMALHKQLRYCLTGTPPDPGGYLQRDDLWVHSDYHSSQAHPDRDRFEEQLHSRLQATGTFLRQAKWLIITYGTAMAYFRNEQLVANCHKLPANQFRRELTHPEKIVADARNLIRELHVVNPGLQIIFTLSPVRHAGEGMEGNSVSKATLRLALHELTSEGSGYYFPAYEILLDELRDYRFYGRDLLHPSEVASDYIWQRFTENCFTPETLELYHRWMNILKRLEHRPFHPGLPGHQRFLHTLLKDLNELPAAIHVTEEIRRVESQLN